MFTRDALKIQVTENLTAFCPQNRMLWLRLQKKKKKNLDNELVFNASLCHSHDENKCDF